MGLTNLKVFVFRNDVKMFLICVAGGGLLQFAANQYLKRHPEFLKDAPVIPKKSRDRKRDKIRKLIKKDNIRRLIQNDRRWRLILCYREGGGITIITVKVLGKVVAEVVINTLAQKGLALGFAVATGGYVVSKLPLNAVSTYLQDAFPQNLPDLEKKLCVHIAGENIHLDQCDQDLGYLFKMLKDESIPFEKKEDLAESIITKYLNLETSVNRAAFIVCMGVILYIFYFNNPSGFFILIKKIIKAIRDGRISKQMGRALIRRLKREGLTIDPDLLEAVTSKNSTSS